MPAPFKKVNVSNVKVLVEITGVTGDPLAFWPVVCHVTKNLSEEIGEIEINSSCGRDTLPGQETASMDIDVLWLEAASYTGEDVITARELYELFKSKADARWKVIDTITGNATDYGKSFTAWISSFSDAIEVEGAITSSLTLSVRGAVAKEWT